MVHPTRGDRQPVFGFEEVREAARDQEQAERLRLYYVAMTRAIDRLIVSGAIDPERTADRDDADRLGARPPRRARASWPRPTSSPSSSSAARRASCSRSPAHARAVREEAPCSRRRDPELQLALFDELPPGRPRLGIELPALAEIPEPPVHDVRRLSYSALALFERCSYRFYAERVLGLPP